MTEKPTKSPEEKTTLETEEKKPARWSFLSGADGNTLVFKRSHLYAVLLPLTFIVGLSVGYLFWGRRPAVAQPQAAAQAQQQDQQNVQRYDVPVDDDPALGPANAPITIIEFSDYECPYCRRWHTEVFNQLRQEYGDKIRFVYRDFPLSSIHPDAEPAAEAANCANEQGAFWQYHDLLFSGAGLSKEIYMQYAVQLGLDVQSFQTCIDSGRYSQEVQADYQYASQLGVRSTPTFFINGLPVVGAQPYDVFKQVIDQELAGEIP
jgi:protein-disulfide isomerase